MTRNIILLYVIKISRWFMLYMPVVKLFLEENNLGDKELLILQAFYAFTIATMEIPSGYFADIFGRKRTLIIGTIFGFTGFLLFSVFNHFWEFLLANIALGCGLSFISGSDSAMLYDTLADIKKEKQYLKFEGRITAIGNFSEAFAGIIATLLIVAGYSSFRLNYILQSIVASIGIMASIFLIEPKRHVLVSRSFRQIIEITKYALFQNRILSKYIVFSSIMGFASNGMAWFTQIYLYKIEINNYVFTLTWTLLNIIVGIGSIYAYKVERRTGRKNTMIIIFIIISLCYILNGIFIVTWAVLFLMVFYFARGIATPVFKSYINELTSSDIRATVLSIRSMIIRLLFFIIGPVVGFITEKISFGVALIMCGILIFITGFYTILIIFYKRKV